MLVLICHQSLICAQSPAAANYSVGECVTRAQKPIWEPLATRAQNNSKWYLPGPSGCQFATRTKRHFESELSIFVWCKIGTRVGAKGQGAKLLNFESVNGFCILLAGGKNPILQAMYGGFLQERQLGSSRRPTQQEPFAFALKKKDKVAPMIKHGTNRHNRRNRGHARPSALPCTRFPHHEFAQPPLGG